MANRAPGHPVDAFLDERSLRKDAGSRIFEAGKRLFVDGCVRTIDAYEDMVSAMVFDSTPSHARLAVHEGALVFACTCGSGKSGRICAHCVALALAWLDRDSGELVASGEGEVTTDDVVAVLMLAGKEMLVEIILSQAATTPALMKKLIDMAAIAKAEGLLDMDEFDLDAARRDVEDAIVEYEHGRAGTAGTFAAEMVQISQSLDEMIGSNTDSATLLDLIEFAFMRTARAAERTRGDGLLPGLYALAGTYCNALRRIVSEDEEQAGHALALVLRSDSPTLARALAQCLDRLDDETLDELRAQCLAALNAAPLPAGGPEKQPNILTMFVLEFASTFGDTDLILAVLTKNPTTGHAYRTIIDTLQDAKRRDEALDWAERGLAALPLADNALVVEYLKGEYKRRGMNRQRTEMMLIDFQRHPSVQTYHQLRTAAGKFETWEEMRTRAFAIARERGRARAGGVPDATLVVQMLLHEGDINAAWEEAIAADCDTETWLSLAAERATTHPADAIAVYLARIDELTDDMDQEAYLPIVHILRLAEPLMGSSEPNFREYVAGLRAQYKRRRTFVALLDETFPEQKAAVRG